MSLRRIAAAAACELERDSVVFDIATVLSLRFPHVREQC